MKEKIKGFIPYVIIIVCIILLRAFIITPVRVDGTSMNKTLSNGDLLLLSKLAKIDRYDIVVIKDNKEKIIKRIIGMPGDTVEIKKDRIYINDEKIEDEFAFGETSDYSMITLKDDEYFVLGDNRLVSKDSRYFGPVKKDAIEGQAIFRFFPFTKIGSLN